MNDNELLKRLLQSQFRLEDRIKALEEQCELYKSDLERWKADCKQSDKRLHEIKKESETTRYEPEEPNHQITD